MSLSSATTLISPTSVKTTAPSTSAAGGGGSHATNRRPSVHAKRRASTHAAHSHGHGHGHHSHAGNRRSSEGEHGRRALAAGLAMHALDTTDALVKKKKEKRPLPKNSRSDTHLPRLSRTTSITSTTSHDSHGTTTSKSTRPKARRGSTRRSEESVQVLKESGEDGDEVDEAEEGWESGEDQLEISPEKSKKGKSRTKETQTQTASSNRRRTVSDTSAEPQQQQQRQTVSHGKAVLNGDLTASPLETPHPPALTQRTTGFAGAIQPPDPQVAAELPVQDPHPIVTPHPIRRNTSAKSLVGPISMEPTASADSRRYPSSDREGGRDGSRDRAKSTRPEVSSRLRSTEGSGLPQANEADAISTSPSYPFPQMSSSNAQESAQTEAQQEPSESQRQRNASQSQPQTQSQGAIRSRQTSQQHPQLRHRYSNSSLRSIQSLRAPPHPLNSPTGYRTHATTATSRPGSMFGSPTKDDKRQRVPSMHQPPVPQPQISYEMAKGQGWDGPIPEESTPRSGKIQNQSQSQSHSRKDSISSQKSIRSIFAPLATPATATLSSPARSTSGTGRRRKTALEAASLASRMPSTNDPTLYHNSLGHANIPETVYLISRFLPSTKKAIRPRWEMDMRDPDIQQDLSEGRLKVGLTNGDYRESHESLVKTLKELGKDGDSIQQNRNVTGGGGVGGIGRPGTMNRSYSSSAFPLGVGSGGLGGDGVDGLSMRLKDGLTIKKGGFAGKTPFELSVQRCLAQRPGGTAGIGF
ncbi:hypothetical protein I203_104145 [Kwoniella mangroviensis CBS 8507]|uniref:uncharacterized protein n=1 Tax=Kwoniella mangroviensis CBS 8507 TaxID=1296122 RepID=UPI00080D3FFF|nr:uncharacterized protein I203_00908 [Kwoniella mangroviensis CBS 8507]OCF70771.1 hypothetical protein I203_00908 [Kwoniella mangroviensis CBS 8507]